MAQRAVAASCKEQLAAAGKLIREAQTLDGSGQELDAYRHYLACVQYMVQTLSSDIPSNGGRGALPTQQATKLFTLARNCLERAESIYSTAQEEQRALDSGRQETQGMGSGHASVMQGGGGAAVSQRVGVATAPHRPVSIPNVQQRPTSSHIPMSAGAGGGRGAGMPLRSPPNRAQSLPARQEPPQPPGVGRLHRISFMDEAELRNHHLMQQYQAHLRRTSTKMLPSKYQDAGLSMLRRLEENVGVAKIRQQTMARKLRVRELRIQQEGAKSGWNQRSRSIPLSNLSVEDLCEQVTSYENGKHNLIALKLHLRTKTNLSVNVYNLVNEILSAPDHPLAKLLGEGQYTVYLMLKPISSAIEKAGGLPSIEIRLDEGGARQGTDQPTHHLSPPPSISLEPPPSDPTPDSPADEEHLDLLYSEDDDDDDLFALSASPRPSPSSFPPSTSPRPSATPPFSTNGGDLEARLALLRSSLVNELSEREMSSESVEEREVTPESPRGPEAPPGQDGCRGDGNEEPAYFLLGPEHGIGGALGTGTGNEVLESGNGTGNRYCADHRRARAEELLSDNDEVLSSSDDDEVLSSYFRDRAAVKLVPGDHGDDARVLLPDSGHCSGVTDIESDCRDLGGNPPMFPEGLNLPDGAGMSRPPPPAVEEEEEEVVFRNLPPLVCTMHAENQKILVELADTADSVLKEVVKLIHSYLNKLEQVFVSCYSPLESEDNRELCRTVLEASFFPAILSPLVMVYRCRNYLEELATAKNMCRHVNATPKSVSVRKKFWLMEQGHAPYGEAMDKLRTITSLQCPSPKLECLVQLSKLIIQCIEEFHEGRGQPTSMDIGVDDILPILTYVILRSGLPQLVTECAIMEEFIHEGYMKGEEGFCLTSFMTALKYVSQMSS